MYNLHVEDNHNYSANDLIVSNCHLATAKSITGIMQKLEDSPFRYGFTGTLKDSKTNEMVLTGLFGPVFTASTTKELMDKNYISKLEIYPVGFVHSKEKIKPLGKLDYQGEISYINSCQERNEWIKKLALSLNKNSLILFDRVDTHGRIIYDMIKSSTDRHVYFIYGGIESEERENVRKIMEQNDEVICVASSGVFSTGISIRNLHNVVFASSGKSKVRVLQSIGRSLRLHDSKDSAKLFDLFDDMRCGKKTSNYTLRHFMERLEIYRDQGFKISPVKTVAL